MNRGLLIAGWRSLGEYGLFRTFVYACWEIANNRTLGLPRQFRNRLLGALAAIFNVLRISSIPVTVNDVRIHIDPRSFWSLREYALRPVYDRRQISAVRSNILSSYTFVDIGANFGAWGFSLASHFSKVVMVEPDPRCYSCCERSSEQLGLGNVEVVKAALTDTNSDGLLFPSASHIGDSRLTNPGDSDRMSGIPVQLLSFDSLAECHNIDPTNMFIKLDAQGAEPLILQGMVGSLTRAKDVILYIELQQSILAAAGSSVDDCLLLLQRLEFVPVDLHNSLSETNWRAVLDSSSITRDFCFRLSR